MDAVADEFGVEGFGVKNDAGDAGLAVIETAHGVEGVGGADGAGGDGGAGLLGGSVGMARGLHRVPACSCIFNEFDGARDFGRDGHEADVSAGGLMHAFEEGDGWRLDIRAEDGPPRFRVGNEGAFEVDADGPGGEDFAVVFGCVDGVGDAFERAQGAVYRSGDGGGEIICNTLGGKKSADVSRASTVPSMES